MLSKSKTAVEALESLISGNERFIAGSHQLGSLLSADHRRKLAQEGQAPFAVVLTCADSRVPPELIFDRGLGDLFVVRVAGNVVMPSTLASVEFAAQQLGAPLCIVLGHTQCGAVKAAVNVASGTASIESPHLAKLINRINPSVRRVMERQKRAGGGATLDHCIHEATVENVRRGVSRIKSMSPVITGLVDSGKLAIMGAVYDLASGRVEFDFKHFKRSGANRATQADLAQAFRRSAL